MGPAEDLASRTITGRILVSVDGKPADDASVNVAFAKTFPNNQAAAVHVGHGTYKIIFSKVPKDASRLEVTAKVTKPHHNRKPIHQTLIVDISKGTDLEIPINISTN